MQTMVEIFEKLEDMRDNRGKKHKLIDIIVMSIYAIICGESDYENIADWIELRKEYFIGLLKLEHGIPCADTFLRVFRGIEPQKFMEMFAEWVRSIPVGEGRHIAIDGKAVKRDIDEYFRFALNDVMEAGNISCHITKSYGHGRIEKRKYYIVNDESLINHINDRKKWKNLKSVGMVENTREIDGKKSVQRKYYILDIDVTAEKLAEITRNHWQIENGLHWILDVHFKEDFSTSKKDNSIFNLSLLRKICFNLIKLDESFGNISFKKKLNRCNFDFHLLENLIFSVIPNNC